MKVLVAGATGILGKHVSTVLTDRGHDVDRGGRRAPVRVILPDHLPEGPYGAVVHCAADPFGKARDVEVRGLQALRDAYPRARIVYPSIVGCDKIRFSYYRVKSEAEQALHAAGGDHAILRLTQFHEFADRLARLPVPMVFAGMRAQTIAARDAAEALVDIVESDQQGLVGDVGGLEVHRMKDLIKQRLRADGRRRPVLTVPIGYRGFKAGYNLCPEQRVGRTTWAEHLVQNQVLNRK